MRIFVCFIGTDGSGKSTLADNIFQDLLDRNIHVKKIYGRYQPALTRYLMILGRKFFLRNRDRLSDYDKYLHEKRVVLKNASTLTRLYINLILIEYYFEILFKLIIPYKLGYSIISDRYVYDTIINDIAVDLELSIDEMKNMLRKSWLFLPKPDIKFLVQVPEEIALKRKQDIPSANYLKIRNGYYNSLADDEHTIVLDGREEVSQLKENVLAYINQLIAGKTENFNE